MTNYCEKSLKNHHLVLTNFRASVQNTVLKLPVKILGVLPSRDEKIPARKFFFTFFGWCTRGDLYPRWHSVVRGGLHMRIFFWGGRGPLPHVWYVSMHLSQGFFPLISEGKNSVKPFKNAPAVTYQVPKPFFLI